MEKLSVLVVKGSYQLELFQNLETGIDTVNVSTQYQNQTGYGIDLLISKGTLCIEKMIQRICLLSH